MSACGPLEAFAYSLFAAARIKYCRHRGRVEIMKLSFFHERKHLLLGCSALLVKVRDEEAEEPK